MGSYSPGVAWKLGEVASETDGAPARDAEGSNPREPGITLDSSERLSESEIEQ